MAFQIKDDLLDYSSNKLTGKVQGNDIKERKMNLPLLFALKNCSKKEKTKILNLLYKPAKKKEDIGYIINFVEQNNGIKCAEKILNLYKDKALKILSNFPDSDYKESISNLLDYIIERTK